MAGTTRNPQIGELCSLILSRATVERGEREVVQVPRSADGRSAGPLPLRPPLRWWESGGTSDPCLRRVDSRVGFPGGAGEVVAAAALWNKVAGSCSPSRRCSVGCCRRDSGVGLAGVVLAWGTSSLGVFWSSRLLPRAAVAVGSCGSSKLVEEGGDGSGLPVPRRPVLGVRAPRSAEAGLQLLPVLFVVLLQAWRLARAGVLGLTAGEVRGAAPADVALAFARSRRPRRVDTAATSTRSSPLKFLSGDSAAACGGFFSPSGEDVAPVRAAADRLWRRRSQGLSCYFFLFQGSFCISGTAVPCLDYSCIFLT